MINSKLHNNFFNFNKKNIYLIGGSGLIGSQIVSDLINYNAKVINVDMTKHTKKYVNYHKNYEYVNYDISNHDFENSYLIKIFKKYGDPDVLINCSYPRDELWTKNNFQEIDNKSFKKNIDLHLCSYSLIAKETANYMVKKKIKGSILLFSSIYGFLGQDLTLYKNTNMRENMTYPIIKSGIINLVKQMCSFYGKYNLRINSISPGGLYGHEAGKRNKQNINFIKNYSNKTPLKRLCYNYEVSKLVLFLISSKSSYITGSNLIIDGGISIV